MTKQKCRVLFVLGGIVFISALWFVGVLIFQGPLEGELRHDFGIVQIERPASVLEHTFRLRNRTDHTLQLIAAKPTCGCTTTDWPTDPVLSGEELLIPVQLKLQRSQLRKSQVRLIFESGEEATLHIQGVGRFKQSLTCMPPTFTMTRRQQDRMLGVLRLEWYSDERPPQPEQSIPFGIHVELDQWQLSMAGDARTHTPQIWTIRLYVTMDENSVGDMSGQYIVGLKVGDTPQLQIPLTIEPSNNFTPTFGNP